MKEDRFKTKQVVATLILAVVFWFITFCLPWGVFWIKISVSASILATLAFLFQPAGYFRIQFSVRNILIGVLSAVALYLIFWIGKAVSTAILPFAAGEIDAVYGKGTGTPNWLIVLLLFFVTGPCEEIYWRGYLQQRFMERFGGVAGWLLAAVVYGAVHISSGNFMLTAAAVVAGLFWGAIYWRYKNLTPVIISHSIWSTVIFAVLPIP